MYKTHWKKIVSDPNYIGEADFQDGQEIVVTIENVVSHEAVKTAEGKQDKAVVHFKEGYKPMILNVAKSKSIAKVAGSPYFEDWPGVKIQLYIDPKVRAFGEVVSAVRVRSIAPKAKVQEQNQAQIKCENCGNDIQPFKENSSSKMAAYTVKKYGKQLCAECAKKEAELKEAQEENNVAVAEEAKNETDG